MRILTLLVIHSKTHPVLWLDAPGRHPCLEEGEKDWGSEGNGVSGGRSSGSSLQPQETSRLSLQQHFIPFCRPVCTKAHHNHHSSLISEMHSLRNHPEFPLQFSHGILILRQIISPIRDNFKGEEVWVGGEWRRSLQHKTLLEKYESMPDH